MRGTQYLVGRYIALAGAVAFALAGGCVAKRNVTTGPPTASTAAASTAAASMERLRDDDFARLLEAYARVFTSDAEALATTPFASQAEAMVAIARLGLRRRPMRERVQRAARQLKLPAERAWHHFQVALLVGDLEPFFRDLFESVKESRLGLAEALSDLPKGDLLAVIGGKCETLVRSRVPNLEAFFVLNACLEFDDAEFDCVLALPADADWFQCRAAPPELTPAEKQRRADRASLAKNPSRIPWLRADQFPSPIRRPVLVVFEAVWCAPCKEYQDVTFADPRVSKHIRENFDAVLVDMTNPSDDGAEARLAERFGAAGLPAIYVLDSTGEIVAEVKEFEEPDVFLPRIEGVR